MLIIAILIFILILSILVLVHELGHFWVAKRNHVRVEEFGFGYPPRIFGIYKSTKTGKWRFFSRTNDSKRDDINDTIYSINSIPFGGFVKLLGQEGESKAKESYCQKSPWVRAKIIASGALANFLLAWILLTIWFWIIPKNLPNQVVIISVDKNSAAAEADLKPNDFIIKLNDKNIMDVQTLQNITKENKGNEVKLTVRHYGREEVKDVKLSDSAAPLGISLAESGTGDIPQIKWYQAPYYAILEIGSVIWLTLSYLGAMIASLFGGAKIATDMVSGPVGIFSFLYQIIYLGSGFVIRFAAMVSIAVGFTNLLPLPALDGGHLAFIVGEMVRGKKIMKVQWENALHTAGFIILLILFVIITYNDISRLIK